MSLEQSGPLAKRLRRTAAARTLDPSEKGAINYFLGLAICKLFAARLLNVPWLLHLDVFRPVLNSVLTGRSRPDLVGQMIGGGWVALECKGRLSVPDAKAKAKAKAQAQRLVSVNGAVPTFNVGGISYFRKEVLQFFWCDPEPNPNVGNPIVAEVQSELWRHYYAPILDLIQSDPKRFEQMKQDPILVAVEQADIQIGIWPPVLRALVEFQWEVARGLAQTVNVQRTISYQGDGVAVVAGKSWLRPFAEWEG